MIKSLIKEINRAVGMILCCCVSVSLPYYATWSAVTYFKENVHPITLLHVYGFFFVFFFALAFAAEVNKKVNISMQNKNYKDHVNKSEISTGK